MMISSQRKKKRIFDLVFGTIFLVLSLSLLVPITLIIKLGDGGPAISKHIRVGKNSRLFVMYKLRTRKKEALSPINLGFVSVDWIDSIPENFHYDKDRQTLDNVTRFGLFLRKTRLDELPQLWNVLIGNMSLVGPRPELREIADHYNEVQMKRLSVRPGLTGLAQVRGGDELNYGNKILLDNEYVSSTRLTLDVKILLLTFLLPWKKMPIPKQQFRKV